MKKLSLLLLYCLIVTSANAHQLFPVQTDDRYTLKFWADDHWQPVEAEHVIGLRGYEDGKAVKIGYNFVSGDIVIPDDTQPDILTSEFDFGYWTFTENDHYLKPRDEVKGVIYDTRRIYKLGKSIYKWDDSYSKPLGMKVEVTPLTNPLTLKVGDTLTVLVTLDGKPYAGAEFEDQIGELENVVTNNNGLANIKLRTPLEGYNFIGSSVKMPYQLSDTKAHTQHVTGTLAFKTVQ